VIELIIEEFKLALF